MARLACLALIGLLAACGGDPRVLGITGPHPDGVQANTMTHSRTRADVEADLPGIGGAALSNSKYVPALAPRSNTGTTGPRYYGYNY